MKELRRLRDLEVVEEPIGVNWNTDREIALLKKEIDELKKWKGYGNEQLAVRGKDS